VRAGGRSGGEEGIYYRREDYAGFWRRLTVDVIDVAAVLLLFLLASAFMVRLAGPDDELPTDALQVLLLAVLSYAYFVLLKCSRLRTLGYRIGRVRVVDLRGEPPGLFALTIRFLFGVLGPLNVGLDLVWIPSDRNRQALRDKFAHTYVIRADAQPSGRGRILYTTYYLLGTALVFQEMTPSQESPPFGPPRGERRDPGE
jgi:uncharacterized RDD family membrane protein YckC